MTPDKPNNVAQADGFVTDKNNEDKPEVNDAVSQLTSDDFKKRLHDLAKLDDLSYQLRRKEEAKRIGLRTAVLDREVEKRRPVEKRLSTKAAKTCVFEEVEPWPESVDGAAMLDELHAHYSKHVVFMSTFAAIANALWTMHTYCLDAANVSPILAITAPEKRSGKTTLLDLHQAVDCKPMSASNMTGAVLFRTVDALHPTLLADEAETFLNGNEELRGIINSGHRKTSAWILRCVGDDHEPTPFSTWSAKAIALNGRLPSTIEDRSIEIKMRRKVREEHVSPFQFEKLFNDKSDLRRKLVRWSQSNIELLSKDQEVSMPDALDDRARDNWRPLLRIADRCGGQWPDLARTAAIKLSGDREDPSTKAMLLSDIKELFMKADTDKLPSTWIVDELNEMEERPWPEWKHDKPMTKGQLAAQLRPFGVKPKTIRLKDGNTFRVGDTAKGYDVEQFKDVWERYLSAPIATPAEGVTPSQPAPDAAEDHFQSVTNAVTRNGTGAAQNIESNPVTNCASSVTNHVTDNVTVQKPLEVALAFVCDGVTDQKGSDMGEEKKNESLEQEFPAFAIHTQDTCHIGGDLRPVPS